MNFERSIGLLMHAWDNRKTGIRSLLEPAVSSTASASLLAVEFVQKYTSTLVNAVRMLRLSMF